MTAAPPSDSESSTDLRTRSLAELIRRLGADITALIRGEIQLAKQEVTSKIATFAAGAAGVVIGVMLALFGIAALVAGAVLALNLVLPEWASALIVGGGLIAIGAIAALIGIHAIKGGTPPLPTKSIDNAKEDLQWVRQHVTSTPK